MYYMIYQVTCLMWFFPDLEESTERAGVLVHCWIPGAQTLPGKWPTVLKNEEHTELQFRNSVISTKKNMYHTILQNGKNKLIPQNIE